MDPKPVQNDADDREIEPLDDDEFLSDRVNNDLSDEDELLEELGL